MQRILKCDGLLPEKRSPDGEIEDVTPTDICEMKAYVDSNRSLTTPFDIVMSGKTADLDRMRLQNKLLSWMEAGATWWIEGFWGEPEEIVIEPIRQGPPRLE